MRSAGQEKPERRRNLLTCPNFDLPPTVFPFVAQPRVAWKRIPSSLRTQRNQHRELTKKRLKCDSASSADTNDKLQHNTENLPRGANLIVELGIVRLYVEIVAQRRGALSRGDLGDTYAAVSQVDGNSR